jgi:ABC-type polysaccharide/polyol phosphate transport system ATPase subunit
MLVLAAHSFELIEQWCSRVVYLRDGLVEAMGPVDEVVARYKGDVGAG